MELFVVNCRPHNWEICNRLCIFGLKEGISLPPLRKGDVILVRVSGPGYGVRAIWSFEEAIKVGAGVTVPWSDAKYSWILKCKSIVEFPTPFSEDFQTTSKLSTKIPNFPATRIQPSIIHLKDFEERAYLVNITNEFKPLLTTTIVANGTTRTAEQFLNEILSSIPSKEQVAVPLTQEELSEIEPVVEDEGELENVDVPNEAGRFTPYGIVGERIELPILNYAPLNEKGVILLFGYYLQDLGFSHIEEIRSGFPDAIGMKSIAPGKYKRVRIEFEFRSSSFLRHNHAILHCDVLVCWENDWPDCPLEVVELRTALFADEQQN